MAHDYYYISSNEEDEVIIQAVGGQGLSIRVREDGNESSMVVIPAAEIDWIITGLQEAKRKLAQ